MQREHVKQIILTNQRLPILFVKNDELVNKEDFCYEGYYITEDVEVKVLDVLIIEDDSFLNGLYLSKEHLREYVFDYFSDDLGTAPFAKSVEEIEEIVEQVMLDYHYNWHKTIVFIVN